MFFPRTTLWLWGEYAVQADRALGSFKEGDGPSEEDCLVCVEGPIIHRRRTEEEEDDEEEEEDDEEEEYDLAMGLRGVTLGSRRPRLLLLKADENEEEEEQQQNSESIIPASTSPASQRKSPRKRPWKGKGKGKNRAQYLLEEELPSPGASPAPSPPSSPPRLEEPRAPRSPGGKSKAPAPATSVASPAQDTGNGAQGSSRLSLAERNARAFASTPRKESAPAAAAAPAATPAPAVASNRGPPAPVGRYAAQFEPFGGSLVSL